MFQTKPLLTLPTSHNCVWSSHLGESNMKPIEKTLRNLSKKNVAQSLLAIHNQIDYFRRTNVEINGISLITVYDLLD